MSKTIFTNQEKTIFIVCGQSGAGMSTALQVFEDMQFFTADGIPFSMLKEFAMLTENSEMQHFKGFAFGIASTYKALEEKQDTNQKHQLFNEKENPFQDFLNVLDALKSKGQHSNIIYLEANNNSIIKRYATTRRPHPLEIDGYTLETAITKERKLLEPFKLNADIVVDTSNFTLHDLRRALQHRFNKAQNNACSMHINLLSFGFKYGLPQEADMVFDVRFLPNPYFDEKLRPLSGQDIEIIDFIFKDKSYRDFREAFIEHLFFILPYYHKEGRYKICLAIGCTGGQHRSVAFSEFIQKELAKAGYNLTLEHKHLNWDKK